MRSKTTWACCLTAAAFLAGHATGTAGPQDAREASRTEATYTTRAKPGKMHKHLNRLNGTFQASATFWVGDDREPVTSTGTMTNTWIMGGRFMQQQYTGTSGDMGGAGFEGVGFMGYSNEREMYQTIWLDSLTTDIMVNTSSELSSDGRTITTQLTGKDSLTGADRHLRDVVVINNRDQYTFTRFDVTPEGETKTMQIVYDRQ